MVARLRAKLAEQVGNDETTSVKGKQEVHPDPADRHPGSIHAKWGDKPALDADGYPNEHGSGVVSENNKDRRGVLNALFEDMGAAATADQAFVNQYFATPVGERRTPHSPLLQKEAEAHRKEVPTLREQVHGMIGG
jgi:hypothetical protein